MKKYLCGALVILMMLGTLWVFTGCDEPPPVDPWPKAADVERTITTQAGNTIRILDRGNWKYVILSDPSYGFGSEGVDLVLVALQKDYEIIDVVSITGGYGYTISLLVKVEKKR